MAGCTNELLTVPCTALATAVTMYATMLTPCTAALLLAVVPVLAGAITMLIADRSVNTNLEHVHQGHSATQQEHGHGQQRSSTCTQRMQQV